MGSTGRPSDRGLRQARVGVPVRLVLRAPSTRFRACCRRDAAAREVRGAECQVSAEERGPALRAATQAPRPGRDARRVRLVGARCRCVGTLRVILFVFWENGCVGRVDPLRWWQRGELQPGCEEPERPGSCCSAVAKNSPVHAHPHQGHFHPPDSARP